MGGVRWRWWRWWWCVVVVVVVVVMQSVVSTPVVMNEDTHVEEWRRAAVRGKEMIEAKPVEMKEEEEGEMKARRRVEKNVEEEKWRTRMEMIAERKLVEEMSHRRRPEKMKEETEARQEMIKKVEMSTEEKITKETGEEHKKMSGVKEKEEVQEKISKKTDDIAKKIKHEEEPEEKHVEMRRLDEAEEGGEEMITEKMKKEVEEKIKEEREKRTHLDERTYLEMRRRLVKEAPKEEDDLPVLSLHPQEVDIVSGESYTFEINLSKDPAECLSVTLELDPDMGTVAPSLVILCSATTEPAEPPNTTLTTSRHGTATLTATAVPEGLVQYESGDNAFSVVSVMKSKAMTTSADVMGWVYTIAWDVSFLPQIFRNWQRRSVVGLSFDFLTFNFIGFFSYLMFNAGMYWIPGIQDQYEERHPQSILHVRLNDVIFPLYALLCVMAQILQCFFYKREEGQRISFPCIVLSSLLVLAAVVGCILVPLVDDWWWIDVLYLLSYVKLAITCIKYIPQLYVNYSHRSTEAWSIYQVILDFTGGVLSIVQMLLLSANYDDWKSLLTDPAKLFLGLLSILFNVLFFIQHFCLYGDAPSQVKQTKGSLKGEDGPMVNLEGPRSSPAPLKTAETGLGKGEEKKEEEEKEKEGGEEAGKVGEEEKEEEKEENKEGEERREERKEEEKEEEPGVVVTGEDKRKEEEKV